MLANAMPEEEDDQTPSDDDLRQRPIPVNTPPIDPGITANGTQQARAIPLGSTADLESRVRPALTRSVPIGRAIPVDTGESNTSAPRRPRQSSREGQRLQAAPFLWIPRRRVSLP